MGDNMVIGIPLRYDAIEMIGTFYVTKNVVELFEKLDCKIRYLIPNQELRDQKEREEGKGTFYPLTEENINNIYDQISMVDGIFLPGGRVITDFERFIVKVCKKENIPVLGVCLGMQIIANYDRDKVVLNPIENHFQENEDELFHRVMIDENSKLYSILNKKEIMVNSFHRQTVENNDSFTVSAIDENNVIEGIEVKNTDFIIGVQWHPEISYSFDDNSKMIINYFINKCKNHSNKEYVDQGIVFDSYRSKKDDTVIKLYITNEQRKSYIV